MKTLQQYRHEAEKLAVETALKANSGNISGAARALKISRMTLYRLIDQHKVEHNYVFKTVWSL